MEKSSGRLKQTSEHSQRVLIRMSRANPHLNATQVKANWSNGYLLTTRAVRGILLKRRPIPANVKTVFVIFICPRFFF